MGVLVDMRKKERSFVAPSYREVPRMSSELESNRRTIKRLLLFGYYFTKEFQKSFLADRSSRVATREER